MMSVELIEDYKGDLQYISKDLDLTKEGSVVGVSTGSFSDYPKMKVLFDVLDELNIPYFNGIHSVHRTPEAAEGFAKAAPEMYIPEGVTGTTINKIKAKIKFIIGGAGGAAHLPGMQGSVAGVPVLALAIKDSTTGTISATMSELNMPPGRPTGFVADQEIAGSIIEKMHKLELPENFTNIQVPEGLNIDTGLLEELGLTIGKSPIGIETHNIENKGLFDNIFQKVEQKYNAIMGNQVGEISSDNEIPIIIPTIKDELTWDTMGKMKNLNKEGLYMGLSKEEDIKTGNALIYAAKIIGTYNPEVKAKVEKYCSSLSDEVIKRNAHLFEQQLYGIEEAA